ncbi:MAG TPA: hypothetical protein VIF37_08680 [Methylobacter sp.]|jgi:predicted nucleic acid-binding protein
MKIVLNTSPIIFLSKIDSLKLLADVSDDIYAPAVVINELHEYAPPSFAARQESSSPQKR